MKNKFFKIAAIALTLSIVTVLTPAINANAETTNKPTNKIVQVGKYQGVLISEKDLPKGIVPKTVNDMKEAESYIDQTLSSLNTSAASKNANSASKNSKSSKALLGSAHHTQDKVNGGQVGRDFHVKVAYTINDSGRFISCERISSYLSGVNPTCDWSQSSSSYDIDFDNDILNTTVEGDLSNYLLTPLGLIKVNSKHLTIDTKFY